MEFAQRKPDPWIHSPLRSRVDQGLELWFHLFDWRAAAWAGPKAAATLKSWENRGLYLQKNLEFQEDLQEVFFPYRVLCFDCGYCCSIWPAPISRIDCLLYGLSQDSRLVFPSPGFGAIGLRILKWTTPRLLWRFLPGIKKRKAPGPPPCGLLTVQGCSLPWGFRPTLCVTFLCATWINHMSWRDYRRYVGITLKYLHFLTRLVRAAAAASC